MYIRTTATEKILQLRKRTRGVSGGTSASKTISILMALIDYAQSGSENEIISVVSETLPHLKRGAIRDFLLIMESHNYFREARWNKTDFIYTFESGSKIEFFSADQSDKVKGPRRDVLFINEANNIDYSVYTQLEVRTRKIVWLDWNPSSEFWWYTDVVPYNDVDFLILTYKDNEALGKEEVFALEQKKKNPNMAQWWKVYGEGLLGEAEERIFKGWQIVDAVPFDSRLEGYGLDFGYTNDPTAITGIYKFNDGYILDEVAYTTGLSNRQIADIFINIPRALVMADSAEPKSIAEILGYGVNIVGSTKGQGSVLQGIQYVQQQKISVTKQSLNTIKEYRNYLWLRDPHTDKVINEPAPIFNHMMDAIRYGFSKNFVEFEPRPEYHAPNIEVIRAHGAKSDYGGVGWNRTGLAR